jgi:PhnB protein
MQIAIQPYLFLGGRCEEALEFYRRVLGAEVEMMIRYGESPEPAPPGMLPPGFEKKIMHSSFRVGSSTIMASDGCGQEEKIGGFSLALAVATEADARRIFDGLAEGGTVTMPLTKTFWSVCFGMLTDRFGVAWMVNVAEEGAK